MRTRIKLEADEIVATLKQTQGDVEQAAELLDVSARTLYRRMRDYGIRARVQYDVEGEAA